jgi:hypothetical protein
VCLVPFEGECISFTEIVAAWMAHGDLTHVSGLVMCSVVGRRCLQLLIEGESVRRNWFCVATQHDGMSEVSTQARRMQALLEVPCSGFPVGRTDTHGPSVGPPAPLTLVRLWTCVDRAATVGSVGMLRGRRSSCSRSSWHILTGCSAAVVGSRVRGVGSQGGSVESEGRRE